MRQPMFLLAIVPAAAAVAANEPSTRPAATCPADTTLVGPLARTLSLGPVHTLKNPNALLPLTGVTVTPSSNDNDPEPHAVQAIRPDNLGRTLAAAKPIPTDDRSIDRWQYAPAYRVGFAADGRRWSAELFLGGRGVLVDGANRRSAFSFTWPQGRPK